MGQSPGQIGGGESHCDVRKDNDVIDWSPLRQECTDSIRYRNDGTILSTNNDWNQELNEKLNLNHKILKLNRKQTLQGVIDGIKFKRGKGASWTLKDIRSQLAKWATMHDDGMGRAVYYPYYSIVVYYLKKKIEQMGK